MERNKFIFLLSINVLMLFNFSACKTSCNCSERDFANSLLNQMKLNEGNDGFLRDSECLYAVAEVLENLSEYKRHTKYGHWGEHYDSNQILKSDSSSYDSILVKMTIVDLRQKLIRNCKDLIEIQELGCFDNLRFSACECYIERLKIECAKK